MRNAYATEYLLGPPSELVDIPGFIRKASFQPPLLDTATLAVAGQEELDGFTPEMRGALQEECSVEDIKASLEETWHDIRSCARLMRETQECIEDAQARKDKLKAVPTDERALQYKTSKGINLASWDFPHESHYFIRGIRNGDVNALTNVKHTPGGADLPSDRATALLNITVYTSPLWAHGPYYRPSGPPTRTSLHVLLASQSLEDLYNAIPCTSKGIPEQIVEDDSIIGFRENKDAERCEGRVVVIENVAYGDGRASGDYADKLLEHFEKIPDPKRALVTKASTCMRKTSFSSLSLRLNEPYWLLHQGNCEHFFTIDSLRLPHPTDTTSGYPLTLYLSPITLDICRACNKVPARISIVGDVRLGESPCVLCDPCWEALRVGKEDDVVEVPLPRHELGW